MWLNLSHEIHSYHNNNKEWCSSKIKWSIKFQDFDQFLFVRADFEIWLVATKDSIGHYTLPTVTDTFTNGSYPYNTHRNVIISSKNYLPHTVQFANDLNNSGGGRPLISLQGWNINNNDLYSEHSTPTLQNKPYYVFIRNSKIDNNYTINSTDTQRSIRAYEVKQYTKKSLHDWFENTKSYFKKEDFYKIYIDYPREELIQRIGKRTEQMIKIGAINEVKRFVKLKVRKDKSVNKAIGIHEIKEYLEKRNDMSEVIEKISIKTRQYAKRQSTWARGNMMSWLKLPPQDLNKFLKKIK